VPDVAVVEPSTAVVSLARADSTSRGRPTLTTALVSSTNTACRLEKESVFVVSKTIGGVASSAPSLFASSSSSSTRQKRARNKRCCRRCCCCCCCLCCFAKERCRRRLKKGVVFEKREASSQRLGRSISFFVVRCSLFSRKTKREAQNRERNDFEKKKVGNPKLFSSAFFSRRHTRTHKSSKIISQRERERERDKPPTS